MSILLTKTQVMILEALDDDHACFHEPYDLGRECSMPSGVVGNTCKQLVSKGMAELANGSGGKEYRITPSGRKFIANIEEQA